MSRRAAGDLAARRERVIGWIGRSDEPFRLRTPASGRPGGHIRYREAIPLAEQRYERYLKERLEEEDRQR